MVPKDSNRISHYPVPRLFPFHKPAHEAGNKLRFSPPFGSFRYRNYTCLLPAQKENAVKALKTEIFENNLVQFKLSRAILFS